MPSKFENIISRYISEFGSTTDIRHIALLLNGPKVVSVGYSDPTQCSFNGIRMPSKHAEMDALRGVITPREKRLLRRSPCNLHSAITRGSITPSHFTTKRSLPKKRLC